jgi:hypothetical protein
VTHGLLDIDLHLPELLPCSSWRFGPLLALLGFGQCRSKNALVKLPLRGRQCPQLNGLICSPAISINFDNKASDVQCCLKFLILLRFININKIYKDWGHGTVTKELEGN